MTVQELIEALEEYDPEATVHLMEQPSWPFEYSIDAVKARCEFGGGDDEEENEDDLNGSDVFLLEGRQLRYGSKDAWEG